MCIYTYGNVHIDTYIHMRVYTHIMYLCKYLSWDVYIIVNIYIYICILMFIYIYTHRALSGPPPGTASCGSVSLCNWFVMCLAIALGV